MRAISVVLLAIIAFAFPIAAFAATNDVFTVRNVPVDATSDGAAQARDIALAQGQRTAYQRLLQRLTRREDWSRLPDASGDQLQNLVLGYQVADEQSSSTHYIAKITYSFKPPSIRNLLRTAGVAFSETRSRPVLVLPVYESPGQIVLFEEPNPWKAAWARHDLSSELVPVILPSNDLEDSRAITATQAKAASWGDVAGLAQKYGVDRVLIADAAPGASGALVVKTHIVSVTEDSVSQQNFTGADPNAELDQAVEAGLSRIAETWKAATIINGGEQNTLVASVPFSSLQEWLGVRRKLRQTPTIQNFDVLALSTQGAEVQLIFGGTPDQLRIALAQVSLKLDQSGSHWRISAQGTASDASPLMHSAGTVVGSAGAARQ
ncbi:MAG: DUF2066 domain-containing protein [Alphaproteobacteria bacterium]